MNEGTKLLVVEDERAVRSYLTAILNSGGFFSLCAASARGALTLAFSHHPELMLLDLGLPDMDGMELLRGIREWSDLPVIVVSARREEREIVAALDAGADDYLVKPFGGAELLARVRAALRRQDKLRGLISEQSAHFRSGGLSIDYASRRVRVDDAPVHLTPIEYKILVLLSQNHGKVLTHDHILREVWGAHEGDSQILRVNMANIRRKIETAPADPEYILTEVGVGYRLA